MTDISEEAVAELIAFLKGAGPLDGVWFGDKHPTEKGAFWWRSRIEAFSELRAEVTRLTAALAAAEAEKVKPLRVTGSDDNQPHDGWTLNLYFKNVQYREGNTAAIWPIESGLKRWAEDRARSTSGGME